MFKVPLPHKPASFLLLTKLGWLWSPTPFLWSCLKPAPQVFFRSLKRGSVNSRISLSGWILWRCLCKPSNNNCKPRGVYSVSSDFLVSEMYLHHHLQTITSSCNTLWGQLSTGKHSFLARRHGSKFCKAYSVLFTVFSGQLPSIKPSSSSVVTLKLKRSFSGFRFFAAGSQGVFLWAFSFLFKFNGFLGSLVAIGRDNWQSGHGHQPGRPKQNLCFDKESSFLPSTTAIH